MTLITANLQIKTEVLPLADVEAAWNKNSSKSRIVLAPNKN